MNYPPTAVLSVECVLPVPRLSATIISMDISGLAWLLILYSLSAVVLVDPLHV